MESSAFQKALSDTTKMYEKKLMELVKQIEDEHRQFECAQEQLDLAKRLLSDQQKSAQVN